eukprot:5117139-Pleurochrysis_carterae.AAC.3
MAAQPLPGRAHSFGYGVKVVVLLHKTGHMEWPPRLLLPGGGASAQQGYCNQVPPCHGGAEVLIELGAQVTHQLTQPGDFSRSSSSSAGGGIAAGQARCSGIEESRKSAEEGSAEGGERRGVDERGGVLGAMGVAEGDGKEGREEEEEATFSAVTVHMLGGGRKFPSRPRRFTISASPPIRKRILLSSVHSATAALARERAHTIKQLQADLRGEQQRAARLESEFVSEVAVRIRCGIRQARFDMDSGIYNLLVKLKEELVVARQAAKEKRCPTLPPQPPV